MLFNLQSNHVKAASDIDALTLLHFVADAVADWECHGGCEDNNNCPFLWEFTRMPENVKMRVCLLESIKDNAYVNLEKPVDDYGNPIPEEELE